MISDPLTDRNNTDEVVNWTRWASEQISAYEGLAQLPTEPAVVSPLQKFTFQMMHANLFSTDTQIASLPTKAFGEFAKTLTDTMFSNYNPPDSLSDADNIFKQLANGIQLEQSHRSDDNDQQPSCRPTCDEWATAGNHVLYPSLQGALPSNYSALLTLCAARVWLTPQYLFLVSASLLR